MPTTASAMPPWCRWASCLRPTRVPSNPLPTSPPLRCGVASSEGLWWRIIAQASICKPVFSPAATRVPGHVRWSLSSPFDARQSRLVRVIFSIPKGLRPPAHGLRRRSYPGSRRSSHPTPTGLWQRFVSAPGCLMGVLSSANATTPLGLASRCAGTQGSSRTRNPWAGGRNPDGGG